MRTRLEPGKVYENERGVQLMISGAMIFVRYPHRRSTDLYLALVVGKGSILVNCSRCKRKVKAIEGRARYHRRRGERCLGSGRRGYHPVHCCNCGQDVADGKLLEHVDQHDSRRRRR